MGKYYHVEFRFNGELYTDVKATNEKTAIEKAERQLDPEGLLHELQYTAGFDDAVWELEPEIIVEECEAFDEE